MVGIGKTNVLNNGFPQGSVLAPTLFNIYIHNVSSTISMKFLYAHNISIAMQCIDSGSIKQTLKEDLNVLENFFKCGN